VISNEPKANVFLHRRLFEGNCHRSRDMSTSAVEESYFNAESKASADTDAHIGGSDELLTPAVDEFCSKAGIVACTPIEEATVSNL
jgi:hypothetical protein